MVFYSSSIQDILPDKQDFKGTHVLLRRDVSRTDYGFVLNIFSTKTMKHRERVLQIPVVRSECFSPLCGARALEESMKIPASSHMPIFIHQGKTVLYNDVLQFLKKLVSKIGRNPANSGLHSLRRSGAQSLQKLGVQLTHIMYMEDWHSLAVLDYLFTPFDKKVDIEY